MTLRVLIADDEPLARQRLRQLLQTEPEVKIVGECTNGTETLHTIQRERPDLVLLDVRMPGLNGFEVIEALGVDQVPIIIFITAHQEFALRAFDAPAADYLLKPFDRARFKKAIQRARRFAQRGGTERLAAEVHGQTTAKKFRPAERFAIRSGESILLVKPEEIQWMRSASNYVELHVEKAAVHLLRQTLGSLEQQLSPTKFLRISRSLMVNVDYVKEIRPKSHGDYLVVLRNGEELAASRNYRQQLSRLLGKPT